jgi:hypothetical protein
MYSFLVQSTELILKENKQFQISVKIQQYMFLFLFFLDKMFRPIDLYQVIITKL